MFLWSIEENNPLTIIKCASSWENLFLPYANNKCADQPAHPRSLISAFDVCCLDSRISLFSISKISRLYLASVAEQNGLCLTWSENPKTGFLACDVAQISTSSVSLTTNMMTHTYRKINTLWKLCQMRISLFFDEILTPVKWYIASEITHFHHTALLNRKYNFGLLGELSMF